MQTSQFINKTFTMIRIVTVDQANHAKTLRLWLVFKCGETEPKNNLILNKRLVITGLVMDQFVFSHSRIATLFFKNTNKNHRDNTMCQNHRCHVYSQRLLLCTHFRNGKLSQLLQYLSFDEVIRHEGKSRKSQIPSRG